MQCLRPRYVGNDLNALIVPCGYCEGCNIARQREWAMRILHELNYYPDSSLFLSLTVRESCVMWCHKYSLQKPIFQKWMKRLRKYYKNTTGIKYLACGEYGKPDKTLRPHYHIILLGVKFNEKDFKKSRFDIVSRSWLYSHATWPFGHIHVGAVSYNSARYITKYLFKRNVYPQGCEKPFCVMSNGVGRRYAIDHRRQIKENLYLSVNNKKVGIPRYYKNVFKQIYEETGDESFHIRTEMLLQKKIEADEKIIKYLSVKKKLTTKDQQWLEIARMRVQKAKNIKARSNLK